MEITAQQLAQMVQGTVDGDANVTINNYAKIEEATTGCLTFLANPKYTHFIYTTQASAVLVRNDFVAEHPVSATLIRVADPYKTLADLLNFVNAQMAPQRRGLEQPCYVSEGVELPEETYVGAFAYIGKDVKVGHNVKIYPQVYLGDGVMLGDNVTLYPGVKVYHGCKIGNRCTVHAGSVIGSDGFGFAPKEDGTYEKISQIGIVILEDDVEIGANTTIDRATMGHTIIGRGTKLDNLVQIGHNVVTKENNIFCSQVGVAGTTKIGAWNTFAGQVGVAGQCEIGNQNTFGAQSGIPGNIGDKQVLMGYPVIPARDWARQAVYLKRLPDMQRDLQQIKKELSNKE